MGGEECAHGICVELPTIICLQSKNGELKLGVHIGEEGANHVLHFRFRAKREGPNIVSVCIN
jgi:hypothetical protein